MFNRLWFQLLTSHCCHLPHNHPQQEFLGQPNSALAHELLHTTYTDRSRTSLPAGGVFERQDAPQHPRVQQQLGGGGSEGRH